MSFLSALTSSLAMPATSSSSAGGIGLGRPSSSSNLRASTRHPRQSSQAAYSVFDARQIQTFREAFAMIDQDNDGMITENDLRGLLTSLGQTPTPQLLSRLLPNQQVRGINFSLFLTLMAEHLSPLDTELDLMEAFASFDEFDTGLVDARELRGWLRDVGDRMTEEEIDRLLSEPFLDRKGMFHYRRFCETLRVTEVEEGEALAREIAAGGR